MRRRFFYIALLLSIAVGALPAQEKPTPPVRPQSDRSAIGVTSPDTLFKAPARDSTARATQALPKFDLPEYVITGVVSIDLPNVAKQDADVPVHTLAMADPVEADRDRATPGFLAEKDGLPVAAVQVVNGRIQASSGTRLTSKLGIWLGRLTPEYSLFGDAQYGMSRAYVPFSNRSGGQIDIAGGMMLHGPSEWYDGGKLTGGLGYGTETYRFYGSTMPGLARSVSRFRLGAEFASRRDLVFNYGGTAGLLVTSLTDSSNTVTENQFHVGAESNLLIAPIPIDGRIDLSLASVSRSGAGTLPFLELSATTHKQWYGDFFVQGSAHFYLTQGMLSQKLARVYPHIALGYRILENTIASVSYLGHAQFNTLSALVQSHPYLSSVSTVRQSDLPLDLILAVETEWNTIWRTRLSARYRSVHDYPFFAEGGGLLSPVPGVPSGIWTTVYRGTTSIDSYEADVFAKFNANSYFTMSLEINSSKNSATQWKVPYLPDFRANAGLSLQVSEGFQVLPTLSYVGRRVPDLYVKDQLSDYLVLDLRGEYAALRFLNVFVDFQNVTNARYSEWHSYVAPPLTLTAGIGYRW